MPKNMKSLTSKIVQIVLPLLLAIAFIVLLTKQSAGAAALGNSYPGPNGTQAVYDDKEVATPDATTICGQTFVYSALPTDSPKRIIDQRDFNNCMSARQTPRPAEVATKAIDIVPTLSLTDDHTPRRTAGDGEIIDNSFAGLSGMTYLVMNSWYTVTDNKVIEAYAGGLRDPSGNPNGSVEGVVVVTVSTADYQPLPDEGGQYFVPARVGPVRIVDATNQVLTLVAGDGSVFTFDVASRRPIAASPNGPFQRTAGDGTIVESPKTSYATQDDKIGSQWNETVSNQLVTVLTGAESANSTQGILIVVIADANDPGTVISRQVYLAPTPNGTLHILNATGQQLELSSLYGYRLMFDVAARQFVVP